MWKAEYEKWCAAAVLSAEEQAELAAIKNDDAEMEDRFHAPLSFGTAGLRGIMGLGTARMNVHVIRHVTQSFAEVIAADGETAKRAGVVIAYDPRHQSAEFARNAAAVMAANGVFVRLFSDMRPTPQLSFAIRHYGARAGINITASHNPKAYNGYKVYGGDGAQLSSEFADSIAKRCDEIDLFDGIETMNFDAAVAAGLIQFLGAETDEIFLKAALGESWGKEHVAKIADDFRVVFTPFHGAGRVLVPEVLKRLGVRHILPVAAQMEADGDFPTVQSPNPEDPAGFVLAIDLARKENADLIIGTDPDADRVGAIVLHDGEYRMISGNQMGVLLLGYLIAARKAAGHFPANPATIKSIVSSEMVDALAELHGVAVYSTFTGFKHIAEQMAKLADSHNVFFSFEESYGYMAGTFCRDKDAVTASMLITEMAAWYKTRGMTLLDGLEEHYRALGRYFAEETINITLPGLDGRRKMDALMANLRKAPPASIGGMAVVARCDYESGKRTAGGCVESLALSGSNVLSFTLENGTTAIVRPSGTEPKVKLYILACAEDRSACYETIAACKSFAESILD